MKSIKMILIGAFVIGFVVGIGALPFQYQMYGMESPNLSWIIKIPFLAVSFGIIACGILGVFLFLISAFAELMDPNERWPHV